MLFTLASVSGDAGTLLVDDVVARGFPAFRRIGFITDVPPEGARGAHAHKMQSEYVICVRGGVDVRMESRGRVWTVALREPGRALFLPPGTWRDLTGFAPGTVLALLSSDEFDEVDYLRDYDAFLAWEALQV